MKRVKRPARGDAVVLRNGHRALITHPLYQHDDYYTVKVTYGLAEHIVLVDRYDATTFAWGCYGVGTDPEATARYARRLAQREALYRRLTYWFLATMLVSGLWLYWS